MVPKKGKGKEIELARKEYDKFISEEAHDQCEAHKTIPFIYEWSFKMEKRGWSASYDEHIQALGWESLYHCALKRFSIGCTNSMLMRCLVRGENVQVRGSMMNFSTAAINDMFDLDNAAVESYKELRTSATPDEMAAKVCGIMKSEWTQKFKKALKYTCLSRETKMDYLHQRKHSVDVASNMVTFDRIVMIYGIFKGIKFNVGLLIHDYIKKKVKEEKAKYLWFPTLIIELCDNVHSIEIRDGDWITPVGHNITATVVKVNIKVEEDSPDREEKLKVKLPGQ